MRQYSALKIMKIQKMSKTAHYFLVDLRGKGGPCRTLTDRL